MSDAPHLARPSAALLDDYLSMFDAARALNETGDGFNLTITGIVRRDRAFYLDRLAQIERGDLLPEGWVPMSTRWLVRAGRVVGQANLRHALSPPLEIEGGHVGYFVHPHHRGVGLGTAVLRLALVELRAIGVGRVLVTCNADNARSRRVIERNGGVFDRLTVSPKSGKEVMRFWIGEAAILPEPL